MILDFYVPGEPIRTTAQEGHRIAHGRYHTDKRVTAARQEWLAEVRPYAPGSPWAGPVHLRVDFYFRTSDVKKQGCWKITRPDTDNLLKLLKDVMTEAGFWADDSQVCMEVTSKTWVPVGEECTRIQLYQMQTHGGDD